MDLDLQGVRAYWNRWADDDPLWGVLSFDGKDRRRWDLNEFMRNGEREVALLWQQLERLGVPRPDAVLDFGCGVGRLSQAFGRRCRRVVGIDISPKMIALAGTLNAYPGIVDYRALDLDGVRSLPAADFDLIYSNVVLQHLDPEAVGQYLDALLRLTRPGGLFVFQLPSHRRGAGDPVIHAMPDDAYRARIDLVDGGRRSVRPSERWTVRVRVENLSRVTWTQPDVGSIRVGNQWLDAAASRMVVQDDGRAVLPQLVPPDSSMEVDLEVQAPAVPGHYVMQVDVVHEGVTWFSGRASGVLRVGVRVEAGADDGRPAPRAELRELDLPNYDAARLEAVLPEMPAATADDFPMAGLPMAAIVDWVRDSGAELVLVEDGNRAGGEWVDFRYFVRPATATSDGRSTSSPIR